MAKWQFSSTVEAFNGARIACEARDAGAVTLRVERDGQVLEFIYKSLFARALQVGLSEIRILVSSTDCIPVLSEDGYLDTMKLFGSGWRHVVTGSAQELYQKVKAAEGRSVTIVDVITEAASDSAEAS